MTIENSTIKLKKRIALIAHDHKKDDLLEWVEKYISTLQKMDLYATGTTGRLLEEKLSMSIHRMQSGPLGGDLQIGALIAENRIDMLIFFWDPLEAQPHDPDIKAILRLAVVWNIPIACNASTADFIFTSKFMHEEYKRVLPDYDAYKNRKLNLR